MKRRSEDGAVLVMALGFLMLFTLIVASGLSFVVPNLATSRVVRTTQDVGYAADGGIEAAIERIRHDADLGVEGEPCPTLTLDGQRALNGVNVTVECEGRPGSGELCSQCARPGTVPDRAVLTLSEHPDEGFLQQSQQSDDARSVKVYGGAYSRSKIENLSAKAVLEVTGDVMALGPCNGEIVASGEKRCSNTPGQADPAQGLDPDFPAAASEVPAFKRAPSCPDSWLVPLEPGYYDSAAELTALTRVDACRNKVVWFKPGVYYFDFMERSDPVWRIEERTTFVVAGVPNGWDPAAPAGPNPFPPTGACRTEFDPKPNSGVQIILGHHSRIVVQGGHLQMCPPTARGQQQVALYGLKSGATSPETRALHPASHDEAVLFANPAGAYTPDDGSVATADVPRSEPASLTLRTYGPALPAGASIEAVRLNVRHREPGRVRSVSATVSPGVGPAMSVDVPQSSSWTTTSTDLLALGLTPRTVALDDLSVRLDVVGRSNQSGLVEVDAVELEVVYGAPALRAQAGCLTAFPYPAQGCPAVMTRGQHTTLSLQGTTYAPLSAIDLELTADAEVFGRGVVARSLIVKVTPSAGFTTEVIRVPERGIPTDRVVLFTAYADAIRRLRAEVVFEDDGGRNPGRAVRVQVWDVD